MAAVPHDRQLDSTLALLADGYRFISKRCRRHRSDMFVTRIMLRRAVCVTGEEAARMFYEPDRFTRKGAMPITAVKLLLDKGSVQLLDGEAHHWRKQMFMSLMTTERLQELADLMAECWRSSIRGWASLDRVVLHDAVQEVLCRAVCAWAGLPLSDAEVRQRTREFSAMIDGAGAVGPRNWRGMLLHWRTERWARNVVERVRARQPEVAEGRATHVIAWRRELDGELLHPAVAAVELINVLRPVVAVARFITFAALALHEQPACRPRLRDGDDGYLEMFVQEVRRYYPFFPFIGGRVRQEFDWRGLHFARGTWVLLDLYGTNHDARIWQDPGVFRPERFREWDGSAFNFVPQGGGDFGRGHRCAGEWLTIELMKWAVRLLTTGMQYEVPKQDLRIDLSRMPASPKSRFVITRVRESH